MITSVAGKSTVPTYSSSLSNKLLFFFNIILTLQISPLLSSFLTPEGSRKKVFFLMLTLAISLNKLLRTFADCAQESAAVSYGTIIRRVDFEVQFFSIDNSFDESFYYFDEDANAFSYPKIVSPFMPIIISGEVVFSSFSSMLLGYRPFQMRFSISQRTPTREQGILSFRLALILSKFKIFLLKYKSSKVIQFLVIRFDSLFELIPIAFVDTILPMDGEGPISMPF